jgi:hypothetical protein
MQEGPEILGRGVRAQESRDTSATNGISSALTRAECITLCECPGRQPSHLLIIPHSPQVKCFASSQDFDLFNANTVLEQGFTIKSSSNLTDPAVEVGLVEQSRQFIALKRAQAEICAKTMGDELRYMGSSTVVRDMAFMASVFDGEDSKMWVL